MRGVLFYGAPFKDLLCKHFGCLCLSVSWCYTHPYRSTQRIPFVFDPCESGDMGILWMSVFGPLDLWSLIVFVSLPLAIRLLKQMRYEIPIDADARTAQLDTAFGVLLVISMIPGGLL